MAPLDRESIMQATESVLRRYGPAKATVVDVARELGVSHAAVYKHFPSKAALRDEVARRWLARSNEELTAIADDRHKPPAERLRAWLVALFHSKRRAATGDPELFATYRVLALESSAASSEHVATLLGQLEKIIADGLDWGVFVAPEPGQTAAAVARAVFEATQSFHHPAHVDEWLLPDREKLLAAVCALIVSGLDRHGL
jgi:AcrR family transcriptional regulator